MSIHELEAEALKLAPEDQARLLHKLAMSLDQLEPPLTNEELDKRWAEFEKTGDSIDASQMHTEARAQHGLS